MIEPIELHLLTKELEPWMPADEYDPDTDEILTTEELLQPLERMAMFDPSAVAEAIYDMGFNYMASHANPRGLFGWVLRPRPQTRAVARLSPPTGFPD